MRAPSEALAARYLKAARKAGAEPVELRVEPDGTLRVLLSSGGAPAREMTDLEKWKARREAV